LIACAAPLHQLQSRYAEDAAVFEFNGALAARMRARPGVAGAALAGPLAAFGPSWAPNVNVPDHPFPAGKEPPAETAAVTPGYFSVMGIPIRRGRDLDATTRPGAPRSVS